MVGRCRLPTSRGEGVYGGTNRVQPWRVRQRNTSSGCQPPGCLPTLQHSPSPVRSSSPSLSWIPCPPPSPYKPPSPPSFHRQRAFCLPARRARALAAVYRCAPWNPRFSSAGVDSPPPTGYFPRARTGGGVLFRACLASAFSVWQRASGRGCRVEAAADDHPPPTTNRGACHEATMPALPILILFITHHVPPSIAVQLRGWGRRAAASPAAPSLPYPGRTRGFSPEPGACGLPPRTRARQRRSQGWPPFRGTARTILWAQQGLGSRPGPLLTPPNGARRISTPPPPPTRNRGRRWTQLQGLRAPTAKPSPNHRPRQPLAGKRDFGRDRERGDVARRPGPPAQGHRPW